MSKKVIIVGGGAAGLMAALFAARAGAKVLLLERNEKLGKKIYITGKGRGNLTNAVDMQAFMAHIYRNPRFLYPAFANLDNQGSMRLFEELGLPLKVERGERVFPASDHASDITAALKRALDRAGVETRLNTRVHGLYVAEERCAGVLVENGGCIAADAVVLATGGLSYPSTGSTGDGYRFALDAGHRLVETAPSLVPIVTKESWPAMLMGLSLRNVRLTATAVVKGKAKKLFSEQGEMLFTHFGISGPLVLTLSEVLPNDPCGISLAIDLKPAVDESALNARMLREFQLAQNKRIVSVMENYAPKALAKQITVLAGVPEGLPVHSVTAKQRAELIAMMKRIPLTVQARRGYEEAIITRGGVDVRDINPSTMESRRMKDLYFAGEMMDVDATTGGFNLQIAFSTGALAGKSAGMETV